MNISFSSNTETFFHTSEMRVVNRQEDRVMVHWSDATAENYIAKENVASETRNMTSQRPCAFWCFQTSSCRYFAFDPVEGQCTINSPAS